MGGHGDGALVPAPCLGLQMSQQSVADVVLSQGPGVQRDGVVGGRELMDGWMLLDCWIDGRMNVLVGWLYCCCFLNEWLIGRLVGIAVEKLHR